MEPLAFLAEVLAPPGHGFYCACELSHKKEHVFTQDITELGPHIERWNKRGCDIYFALATYDADTNRTADNAEYLRSLFIDMDGYETKRAAAEALQAFLQRTGLIELGSPWLVDSGGGLHAYWPLNTVVPVSKWKPVAESLKALCKQEGLTIDWTVTADAARVLRVPGTANHKEKYGTPRPVQFKLQGDRFEFDTLAAAIDAKLTTRPVVKNTALELPGMRPTRKPGAAKLKMFQDSSTRFETIWLRTDAGTGCAQLAHYADHAQDDGMEPLWRGLLSWAKVCDDADTATVRLSALHPYDEQRMATKLAEIKGPYPCTKMDRENPGVCGECPHWGKVTNPLVFGREVHTETEAKVVDIDYAPAEEPEVEADEEAPVIVAVPGKQLVRPAAPKGFSYGRSGGIYRRITEKDATGATQSIDVQVIPFDMFVVDMLRQDGEHFLHMLALRPEGPTDVILPMKGVVSRDETVKFLANQNIVATVGAGGPAVADKHLHEYVRACSENASLERRALEVPVQCGWQQDESFVYNGKVYRPNGEVVAMPMPGLENITSATRQAGTLEDWRAFWNMMVRRGMNHMLAVCLDSFGCTLMHYTPYCGLLWHIGSTASGTGKSLTLTAKEGVWGKPGLYRVGKSTSPMAMQQRAGLLHSLPLAIDEITAKSRGDMEWAPAFIFDLAEGKGKERMEAGANKERLNTSTWKLTATMTSNIHLTDYLSGARKHSSYGELLRMLEWTPTKVLRWSAEDRKDVEKINTNYGVAGEAWVRYVVTHKKEVQDVMAHVSARLKESLGFTDEERYWHAGCTTILAAGTLLGDSYAGILNVPLKAVYDALKDIVEKARNTMRTNTRTAEDVLNMYIRENYGKFLIVSRATGPGRQFSVKFGDGSAVLEDRISTRQQIMGRVEHGTLQENMVEFYIEEHLLKGHCVAMSYSYADLCTQLKAAMKTTFIKKNILANSGGPRMFVNVMHISRKRDDIEDSTLPVDADEESLSVG